MPLTLPAHPAPALWLKLRFPGRLAGVALAAGSVAPDLEYILRAEPYRNWGHSLPGLFLFCLPAGLALTYLASRLMLKPLCLHLPDCGALGLRQYWRLEAASRRSGYLATVVPSVLIGAATHLAWDSFTHHEGGALKLLRLDQAFAGDWPLHRILSLASTLLGSAYVLLVALPGITRDDLLDRWYGPLRAPPPSATPRSHAWLWSPLAAGLAAGAGVGLWRYGSPDLKWGWWFAWLIALEALRGMLLSAPLACWMARRTMDPAPEPATSAGDAADPETAPQP